MENAGKRPPGPDARLDRPFVRLPGRRHGDTVRRWIRSAFRRLPISATCGSVPIARSSTTHGSLGSSRRLWQGRRRAMVESGSGAGRRRRTVAACASSCSPMEKPCAMPSSIAGSRREGQVLPGHRHLVPRIPGNAGGGVARSRRERRRRPRCERSGVRDDHRACHPARGLARSVGRACRVRVGGRVAQAGRLTTSASAGPRPLRPAPPPAPRVRAR